MLAYRRGRLWIYIRRRPCFLYLFRLYGWVQAMNTYIFCSDPGMIPGTINGHYRPNIFYKGGNYYVSRNDNIGIGSHRS